MSSVDRREGGVGRSEIAYVGLGANLGSARQTLIAAVRALSALPASSLEAVSPLYRTRPVGPVSQGDFHNAVVSLRVPAGPDPETGATALLIALKDIERALGRVERERWGPRELDLDLLLFGDHKVRVERVEAARSQDPDRAGAQWLEVPHPAAAERLFVLVPLADLVPALKPPGWALSALEARDRAAVAEGPDAVAAVGTWDAERGAWTDSR